MSDTLLAACLLSSFATALVPAQQKVVPAGMDFVEGPLLYTYPFGRQDAAIQLLFDADQVTLGQGAIWGLRLRQSQVTAAQTHLGYTKNYKLTAWIVPTMAAGMSPDPAVNHGGAVGTVVFQGPLTLPPVTVLTTTPAPFGIHLPFNQVLPYDGSTGNLMFVLETDDQTAVPSGYRLDAVNFSATAITGLATPLDAQGCNAGGNTLSLSCSATAAIVGGSIQQTFTASSLGALPVLMAGLSFTAAPSDLTSLGLPGCTSWFGPFASRFELETPGVGYPVVSWPLPNTPSIEGIALVNQGLGIAASGVLTDMPTSNGIATRIGPATLPTMKLGMSFRGTGAWSMGTNGTFVTVVALEGALP
jgi:hypothetical protein